MKNDLAQLWPHGFKSNLIVAVVATTCVVTSTQSFAEQDGRSGRAGDTTSACTSCHTAGATVPTVAFTSPTLSVAPGSITNYTVAITAGTGGPAVAAGIDVAVSAGTLSATDAGTKLSDATTAGRAAGEIVHNAPKAMTAGTASFTFAWTAPTTPGSATLYVAGFASDGALDAPGDAVTLMTLPVTVAGTAANQPPKPLIEGPTASAAGVPVTFDGSKSSDPDGTIATYDWNYGDGTAGSGATVTKSFPAGSYDVTLTVTDNLGLPSTALQNIVVAAAGTNVPPTAKAGGPYSATVGTAISFDGTGSSDLDGTITSYSWDFGDGSTPAAGATVSYTYANAGPYTAILTVTDNANATATSEATVTITAPATVTPPATATEGETFFAAECSECHGPGLLGGDITGESASDIAEAFIEVPDHAAAGVADIPQAHIDAIAAFLNGETAPSPAAADGEGFFLAECDSCHGPTGAAGSIAGESASDIAEAFIEVPDHAAAGVADIPQDHIDAIAAFLATLVDADAVNGAGKPGANASNGNGGAPANEAPKTDPTSTQANTRTGSSGGALDLWLISSMLLLGAWRKRSYQNKR